MKPRMLATTMGESSPVFTAPRSDFPPSAPRMMGVKSTIWIKTMGMAYVESPRTYTETGRPMLTELK